MAQFGSSSGVAPAPAAASSPARVPLAIPADYRGGELRQWHVPPTVAAVLWLLGGVLLFHSASWFIDYTRTEMRAMAEVVDRLALPASSCSTCEKPFRIIELRARPFYDPPTERLDLLDSQRADASAQWVAALRREVSEFKDWSSESKRRQEEEARLLDLGE